MRLRQGGVFSFSAAAASERATAVPCPPDRVPAPFGVPYQEGLPPESCTAVLQAAGGGSDGEELPFR